jgi:hypothetical protein
MRSPDNVASVNEQVKNGYNEAFHPTASTFSDEVTIRQLGCFSDNEVFKDLVVG